MISNNIDYKEIVLKEVDLLIENMKDWDDQKLVDIYSKLKNNARWDQMTNKEFAVANAKLVTMFYEMQKRGIFGKDL